MCQLVSVWDHHFGLSASVAHLSVGQVRDGCSRVESSCGAEFVESFGQSIGAWPVGGSRWQGKESAVHFLKAVSEHRPIDFIHEGTVDVDDVVR
jgi:hypothetical protein